MQIRLYNSKSQKQHLRYYGEAWSNVKQRWSAHIPPKAWAHQSSYRTEKCSGSGRCYGMIWCSDETPGDILLQTTGLERLELITIFFWITKKYLKNHIASAKTWQCSEERLIKSVWVIRLEFASVVRTPSSLGASKSWCLLIQLSVQFGLPGCCYNTICCPNQVPKKHWNLTFTCYCTGRNKLRMNFFFLNPRKTFQESSWFFQNPYNTSKNGLSNRLA